MKYSNPILFLFLSSAFAISDQAFTEPTSNSANLAVIATDSTQRFKLWLLEQEAQASGTSETQALDSQIKNSLDDPRLVLHKGTGDDWQPFLNSHKLQIGSPK